MDFGNLSYLLHLHDENIESESENAPLRCLDQLNGGLTPLAEFIDRSPLCHHAAGRSAKVDIVDSNIFDSNIW